jgi:hypothetical protein
MLFSCQGSVVATKEVLTTWGIYVREFEVMTTFQIIEKIMIWKDFEQTLRDTNKWNGKRNWKYSDRHWADLSL